MQYDGLPKHAGPLNRKERRRLKLHLERGLDRTLATRRCGECTACCTTLTVAELDKTAGSTCQHALGGCEIYQTRPKACREYDCGWRIGIGSDDERPDRVGVTLSLIAPGLPGHPGLIAHELWPHAFDEASEYLARAARGLVVILVRGDLAVRVLIPEDRQPGMRADLARIQAMNAEVRAKKGD